MTKNRRAKMRRRALAEQTGTNYTTARRSLDASMDPGTDASTSLRAVDRARAALPAVREHLSELFAQRGLPLLEHPHGHLGDGVRPEQDMQLLSCGKLNVLLTAGEANSAELHRSDEDRTPAARAAHDAAPAEPTIGVSLGYGWDLDDLHSQGELIALKDGWQDAVHVAFVLRLEQLFNPDRLYRQVEHAYGDPSAFRLRCDGCGDSYLDGDVIGPDGYHGYGPHVVCPSCVFDGDIISRRRGHDLVPSPDLLAEAIATLRNGNLALWDGLAVLLSLLCPQVAGQLWAPLNLAVDDPFRSPLPDRYRQAVQSPHNWALAMPSLAEARSDLPALHALGHYTSIGAAAQALGHDLPQVRAEVAQALAELDVDMDAEPYDGLWVALCAIALTSLRQAQARPTERSPLHVLLDPQLDQHLPRANRARLERYTYLLAPEMIGSLYTELGGAFDVYGANRH